MSEFPIILKQRGHITGSYIGVADLALTYADLAPGVIRELLTADRTYYVRTDGSDSNDGLTNSAAGAFLTWNHAYQTVAGTLDFGGNTVTIQAGNSGTYTGDYVINVDRGWVGAGQLAFIGDTATPANVVLSGTYAGIITSGGFPGNVFVAGFDIRATSGNGIAHTASGNLYVCTPDFDGATTFGACALAHVQVAGLGAYVELDSAYTVNGNAAYHFQAIYLGEVGHYATTTITGTRTFTTFARCNILASVDSFATISVTGSVTGKRYVANLNSVVNTYGSGANYFPGNVAGTTATGGQYA